MKDDDYIRIGRPMTFSWKNKFLQAAATIEKYRLYMSTFPGGKYKLFRRVYGVYATFNNSSVISWWSVLLVEETGVPRENYQPAAI